MNFDLDILKQKLRNGYSYKGIGKKLKEYDIHSETDGGVIMLEDEADHSKFLMSVDENRVDELQELLDSLDANGKLNEA